VPLPEGKPLAQQERAEHRDSVYHIYMAALAMLAILVSVGLFLSPTEPDVIGVLSFVDLWKAPSKLRYLFGWGIIDLLSSIPFVLQVRWLRFARVLRFLMLLRAIRLLWESAKVDRRSIVMAGATFFIQTLFIAICIVVLQVEHDAPDGKIRSASDVLWWAMTTVTTVGYGDMYPVTTTGRIAGAILMVSGIGYLATVLSVGAECALRAGPFASSSRAQRSDRPRSVLRGPAVGLVAVVEGPVGPQVEHAETLGHALERTLPPRSAHGAVVDVGDAVGLAAVAQVDVPAQAQADLAARPHQLVELGAVGVHLAA
jgi:voltage-gated potassium channel